MDPKTTDSLMSMSKKTLPGVLALIKTLTTTAQKWWIKADYMNLFIDYLQDSLPRHAQIKPFYSPDESMLLSEVIVITELQSKKRKIKPSYSSLRDIGQFHIIQASGGSGKSTLMKYLFTDAWKYTVPFFLDLKTLNMTHGKGVKNAFGPWLDSLKADRNKTEVAERLLQTEDFLILLDGFDEINPEFRDTVVEEINSLMVHCKKSTFVVASRLDNCFTSWSKYCSWNVCPLSKDQAIELVSKVSIDNDLSIKFNQALKDGLFEKHYSFLSNPLLLSIMLITYSNNAEIPQKMTLFYEQCYYVLFSQHDARKGIFKRKHRTSLDISEFASLFSAFSFLTYKEAKSSMPYIRAIELVNKCKEICKACSLINESRLNFSPEDFLADASQCVCLLQEEGNEIRFSHRSFQEFYVAKFVLNTTFSEVKIDKAFPSILTRSSTDEVLKMMLEIDRRKSIDYYFLGFLKRAQKRLSSINKKDHFDINALVSEIAKISRFWDISSESGNLSFFPTLTTSKEYSRERTQKQFWIFLHSIVNLFPETIKEASKLPTLKRETKSTTKTSHPKRRLDLNNEKDTQYLGDTLLYTFLLGPLCPESIAAATLLYNKLKIESLTAKETMQKYSY